MRCQYSVVLAIPFKVRRCPSTHPSLPLLSSHRPGSQSHRQSIHILSSNLFPPSLPFPPLKSPHLLNHYLLIIQKYILCFSICSHHCLPRNISAPVPGTAGPITQACSLLFLNPRTSGNERPVSALPSYTDRITPDSTQNNLRPLHYYPILSTVRRSRSTFNQSSIAGPSSVSPCPTAIQRFVRRVESSR